MSEHGGKTVGSVLKEFFVSLGLDLEAQSFAKGQLAIDLLEKGLEKLKEGVEELIHAIPEMVDQISENAEHLELMSTETAPTTESLQELAYAGRFVNVSADE